MVKRIPPMNRPVSARRGSGASKLSAILLATLMASLALLGVLQLLPKSVYPPASAGAWSECLPHLETAIEAALGQRPFNASNLVASGWTRLAPDRYLKTNAVAGGGYAVTMSAHQPFEIMATGFVRTAGTTKTVQRAVRVAAFDVPAFRFAVLVRDQLELKGSNIRFDSFDSRDPVNSPSGLYVAANARDKADTACLSGMPGTFEIGNGAIFGRALTGAGGSVAYGPAGAVGSRTWHLKHEDGIEPGWSRSHTAASFPEVSPPFAATTPPGGIGTVMDGVTYDQVFDNGNVRISALNGRTLVTGLAVVHVTGDIDAELITIRPGAHLLLYGGGASARFNKVDNQSKLAGHLIYFGLPANTSLSLNGDWIGVVCAPNCDLSLRDSIVIHGSIYARSLTATAGMLLHYDEALGAATHAVRPVVASWTEL